MNKDDRQFIKELVKDPVALMLALLAMFFLALAELVEYIRHGRAPEGPDRMTSPF